MKTTEDIKITFENWPCGGGFGHLGGSKFLQNVVEFISMHGITTQKPLMFVVTTVRISALTPENKCVCSGYRGPFPWG
jgi:hypothetical protein